MEGHLCKEPSLLVFSGGTAFNAVAEELHEWTTAVAHVLPVSDDGGSTAEIVRVIGGPAIGDIRSRCLRLSDGSSHEARAVRRLLGHRLPLHPAQAKAEWLSIVEGEHELWGGVSDPYKEIIRAFLLHFHYQVLLASTPLFRSACNISHVTNSPSGPSPSSSCAHPCPLSVLSALALHARSSAMQAIASASSMGVWATSSSQARAPSSARWTLPSSSSPASPTSHSAASCCPVSAPTTASLSAPSSL
ncbi:unnamed protein product [Closterium sp. NIES-54]